jgi:uncharacterized protein YbjT (DUF2867 family)
VKVLVTGGTGATGRRVVARLLARGDAVRVLARRPERAQALGPVEVHRGDVRDPASLVGVGRDVDAVIACVGTRSYVGRNGGPAVDAIGTRNLVAALAEDARARPASGPQLVLMSAFGLDRRSIFLDLFSLAFNRYFRWKAEAEAAVRGSGLAYTIVRPVELHDGPPRRGPLLNQAAR